MIQRALYALLGGLMVALMLAIWLKGHELGGAVGVTKYCMKHHVLLLPDPDVEEALKKRDDRPQRAFWFGRIAFWLVTLITAGGLYKFLTQRWLFRRLGKYDWYCSKCDQYLGTGKNTQCPCPRCGSNRPRAEKK